MLSPTGILVKSLEKMKHNPYKIVQMFEEEISDYTGSPYAVAVDNCTDALFLCCLYLKVQEVTIPKKTYLSVPQSIMSSGGKVTFEDLEWKGIYQLKPYPIYDSARRFTSDMYIKDSFMCLSFHPKKTLKMRKGGMILTDNYDAYCWFKKMRHEGRDEIPYTEDNIKMVGWNMYMTPPDAADGLWLMSSMSKHNPDSEENYPDLTKNNLFKTL
jgi:dTDP-4-amino-4,6-dideoxygalactose transaminase